MRGPAAALPHQPVDSRGGVNPTPGADGNPIYGSRFEYYCDAMGEVGADARRPRKFLDLVRTRGIDAALYSDLVPLAGPLLFRDDLRFHPRGQAPRGSRGPRPGSGTGDPAEMFRRLLDGMRISEVQAPIFYHYPKCHIKPDGDRHGPPRADCPKP